MRCSMRDSQNLRPAMFTSTPIAKSKRNFDFTIFENSPIPKSQTNHLRIPEQLVKYQDHIRHPISIFKVLGNKKIPLNSEEKREIYLKKQSHIHPPMVVISDSEEEDNIDKEITSLENMLNPSNTRKSVYKAMDEPKEEYTKKIRNRNSIILPKKDVLENESKKSVKRVSRLAAIIDEVMKERKSTIVTPSPMVKVKSENNVDDIVTEEKREPRERRVTRSSVLTSRYSNVVREYQRRNTYIPILAEEGMETVAVKANKKPQDKGNKEKINTRRTRKRTKLGSMKTDEEKENNIQYEKDCELKIKAEKTLTPLKENNIITDNIRPAETVKKSLINEQRLSTNHQKIEPDVDIKIPSLRAEPFDEIVPVLYIPEEIEDNEWIQVTDQKGVFIKKNFRLFQISNGFVKIEPKCSLLLNSPKCQIFHVAEGRGTFLYDNDNMKAKIGPGHTVTIPSGYSCKITNAGLKKNLVISFTKVDGV